MNVTSLPSAGANVRVYKTVANGNAFFGNPIPLTLGVNTITVSAVTFDRSVKFQFSTGDIEFSALILNGVDSGSVGLCFVFFFFCGLSIIFLAVLDNVFLNFSVVDMVSLILVPAEICDDTRFRVSFCRVLFCFCKFLPVYN